MTDITAQRRQALNARRRLAPRERARYSQAACRRAARLPAFRRARRIGLYWPLKSEIDPRPLIARLALGQRCYLPRVEGATLKFIAFDPRTFRHRHSALGMIEPHGREKVGANALDLLIMPLAAFDDGARRIGMGGGYYDRTLALPAGLGGYRRPYLVGLAFEVQRVARIETRSWDIDLDVLVTEARVRRFAQQARTLR